MSTYQMVVHTVYRASTSRASTRSSGAGGSACTPTRHANCRRALTGLVSLPFGDRKSRSCIAQHLQRSLVGLAVVDGDRLCTLSNSTTTVRWLTPASYVFAGVPRTTKRPPAAWMRTGRQIGVGASASGLETNGSSDPVALGHGVLLVEDAG